MDNKITVGITLKVDKAQLDAASKSMQAEMDALAKNTSGATNAFKEASVEQSNYAKSLKSASLEAAALNNSTKSISGDLKSATSVAKEAEHAHLNMWNVWTSGALAASVNTARARQEIIVLGHEMLVGNFRRLPGSMMVLAEQMGRVGHVVLQMLGWFAALAAVGYLVFRIFHDGAQTMEDMNKALLVTNNYAGMTRGSMLQLADSISKSTDLTVGQARKIVTELVNTGTMSGDVVKRVAGISANFAKATGEDIDKVAPKLIKLFADPYKGAEELNKQMNFLTGSDLNYIKTLQDQNRLSEAQSFLAERLGSHLNGIHEELSNGEKRWMAVKKAASEAWAAMTGMTVPDTPEEQLAKAQAALDNFLKNRGSAAPTLSGMANARNIRGGSGGVSNQQAFLEGQIELAKAAVKHAEDEVKAKSKVADETKKQQIAEQLVSKAATEQIRAAEADLNILKQHFKVSGDLATQEQQRKDFNRAVYEQEQKIQNLKVAANARETAMAAMRIDAQQKLSTLALDMIDEQTHHAQEMGQIDDVEAAKRLGQTQIQRVVDQQDANAKKLLSGILTDEQRLRLELTKQELAKTLEVTKARSKAAVEEAEQRKKLGLQNANAEGVAGMAHEQNSTAMSALNNRRDRGEISQVVYLQERRRLQLQLNDAERTYLEYQLRQAQVLHEDERAVVLQNQLNRLKEKRNQIDIQYNNGVLKAGIEEQRNYWDLLKQSMQAVSDQAKATSDNLSAAFGAPGKALGDTITALADFGQKQVQISEEATKAWEKDKETGFANVQKIQDTAAAKMKAAETEMYAKMLTAAKGYFKEGSTGYKVLEAAEKAYRTYEMVVAVTNTAKKIALTMGWLTADTAAKSASLATDIAMTAKSVALAFVRTVAGVMAGAATMFGQSGWGGFVGVALMLGVMAALGFRGGGGSASAPSDGWMSAADRQAQNGTGTVLGDSTAKSDSIKNTLQALRDNSDQELVYQSSMTSSLISIDNAMSALAQAVAKTFGVTSPVSAMFPGLSLGGHSNVPGFLQTITRGDPLTRAIFGGIFGSTSTSLDDMGLHISGQSLGGARTNFQGDYYADTTTTRHSLFGSHQSHSRDTNPLESSTTQQFQLFFSSIAEGMTDAIALLSGKAGPELETFTQNVSDFINHLQIPDLNISLKDLKGQDLVDALEHAFSAMGDTLAQQVIEQFAPGVAQFQKVGEGLFETLIRVASGVEHGRAVLSRFHIAAVDYTQIINKQGDVATELVRTSIESTEHLGGALSGVGEIIDNFQGSVDDLAKLYETLMGIRSLMRAAGANSDLLDQKMIQAAGGLSKFQQGLETFTQSFLTAGQRWHAQGNDLATTFRQIGVAMPTTREGFRQLVMSLDLTTERGRNLYGQLMAVAPAFDQVIGVIDDIKKSISDMFGETQRNIQMAGLNSQGKYDFLQRESASLFEQAMQSTDPEQIRQLSQRINSDINDAFGMLTPEQQQQMQSQWLTRLQDVNTKLQDHLSKLPDTLTTVSTALTTVTPAITAAAETNTTAANTQLQAANTQNTAAGNQLTASNKVHTVNVKLTVGPDGSIGVVTDGG